MATVDRLSALSHLECPRDGSRFDAFVPQNTCTCGSPLLARYDLDDVARRTSPALIAQRPPSLWRCAELLPVQDPGHVVSLGETMTPLVRTPRLGDALDIDDLWIKDEGLLPTGTFKARGAAVGVSRAVELGVHHVAMPTNGNAGAAWSAYAARAGIAITAAVPRDAPDMPLREMRVFGADVQTVDGLIGDAGRVIAESVRERGLFDASTLREPYRLEGKKTMGLELVEQLGWSAPDVIVYPTGGGVGLIGIAKALEELETLGWLQGARRPRLVAAQASGCAPIVRAWEHGDATAQLWSDAHTVAFGITVPKPLGDFLILDAVRRSNGCAVAVDDEETLDALRLTGRTEGLFVCPEGAVTVAAARLLRRRGWIAPGERVVLINTGTGLLYPEAVPLDA